MQKPELVEFLCLHCGLQGLHTATTAVEQCPKCDEKLLTLSRPQPEEIVV